MKKSIILLLSLLIAGCANSNTTKPTQVILNEDQKFCSCKLLDSPGYCVSTVAKSSDLIDVMKIIKKCAKNGKTTDAQFRNCSTTEYKKEHQKK